MPLLLFASLASFADKNLFRLSNLKYVLRIVNVFLGGGLGLEEAVTPNVSDDTLLLNDA